MGTTNLGSIKNFLVAHKFGITSRTYAPRPEDVEGAVDKIVKVADAIWRLKIGDRYIFSHFNVLVWADPAYQKFDGSSKSDCGQTATALRKVLGKDPQVTIQEVFSGDIYAGTLNQGLALDAARGINYPLILSPELIKVLTPETVEDMITAAMRGAQVIPVATEDVRAPVLHGFPCNSFCMWRLAQLWLAGGFDINDSKPTLEEDDPQRPFLEPYTSFVQVGDKRMHDAGVGEVLAMVKMFLLNRGIPITAPILPRGVEDSSYASADDPQRAAWVAQKFASKMERIFNMLRRSGYTLEHMTRSVMPEYITGEYAPVS